MATRDICYSKILILPGNDADMNNLQISPVKATDAGHYQCSITDTNYVQTHTLVIAGEYHIRTLDGVFVFFLGSDDCCLHQVFWVSVAQWLENCTTNLQVMGAILVHTCGCGIYFLREFRKVPLLFVDLVGCFMLFLFS